MEPEVTTWQEAKEAITSVYGDPRKKKDCANKLKCLAQGLITISEFFVEVQNLNTYAQLDVETLPSFLEPGLNDDLRRSIEYMESLQPINTYKAWKERALQQGSYLKAACKKDRKYANNPSSEDGNATPEMLNPPDNPSVRPTDRPTDRATGLRQDDEMGGGGKKKRKSNSGKGVPPMPEEEKKKEVNRYEVLGEARQLLSPSPTPSAAGSRFGAVGDEEKDRVDNMAIIVSEDEGDKVDPVVKPDSKAPKFTINLPPSTFRSSADKELIEGLIRELEEVKGAMCKHLGPDGLVGGLEREIAILAKENSDLKRAVLVAEAEAARVKKMHNDHEGFWERKLAGLEESLDLVCQ